MNTAWYILQITDESEALLRCSPSGYVTVPLRTPDYIADDPEVETSTMDAETPADHSPFEPTDVGHQSVPDDPEATHVVNDLATEGDDTERYYTHLGEAVQEVLDVRPAPLYVAMASERQGLFEMVSRLDIRGFVDDEHANHSELWSDSLHVETAA